MRRVTVLIAALLAIAPAAARAADPSLYQVGVGTRSINPGADGLWHNADGSTEKVYLGGYGIGCCEPGNEGRWATSILDDPTGTLGHGLDVRAIAIGDGSRTLVLADATLQGWFTATRDGAYGIADVRKDIEAKTHG